MRPVQAAFALLIVSSALAAVPGGLAQQPATATLTDPTGDVSLDPGGLGGQPNGSPRFVSTDLVGLAVEEQAMELVFTLAVAGFGQGEDLGEAALYQVLFLAEDAPYILRLWAPRADEAVLFAGTGGGLYRPDPSQPGGEEVAIVPTRIDAAAGTIEARVGRVHLTTSAATPLGHGQALRGLHVVASAGFNVSNEASLVGGPDRIPVLRARDRMPDDGALDLPMTLGGLQSGTLRLSSPAALRATNGGPGSFLMEATVHNDGPEEALVVLDVLRSPSDWSIGLEATELYVSAGGRETIDLVVTPAGRHEHGTLSTFLLEARHHSDAASYAQLEMGLHVVDPPQPAGHHPVLYVHVRDTDPSVVGQVQEALVAGTRVGYLTTLEEDPLASDVGIQAGGFVDVGQDGRPKRDYHWSLDLHPGLLLGLQLTDGPLAVSFDLHASVPIEDFVADGVVAHVGPDGEITPLWDFRADAVTTGPDEDFTVTGEGKRLSQRGVFPFEPGAGLRLYLNATGYGADFLFGFATVMLEGGSLRLPLAEYQDEVAVAGAVIEAADRPAPTTTGPAKSPGLGPAALVLAIVALAGLARRRP